eukprot:TRINITY_DN28738_c0_g1_i1.p1 TRINITY_DN28738_c0_g1~~TRINITY_DN28738_c0_g1_i1.p1  ORF type:complete len:183 (+),score=21.55 TRINITY_DN28738_c0_g1_i1:155-703(+)
MNRIDNLDLDSEIQDEVLNLPAFYSHQPKGGRKVGRRTKTASKLQNGGSRKRGSGADLRDLMSPPRVSQLSSSVAAARRGSLDSASETITFAGLNLDSEFGTPEWRTAPVGKGKSAKRRDKRQERPTDVPLWFKDLKHDSPSPLPTVPDSGRQPSAHATGAFRLAHAEFPNGPVGFDTRRTL